MPLCTASLLLNQFAREHRACLSIPPSLRFKTTATQSLCGHTGFCAAELSAAPSRLHVESAKTLWIVGFGLRIAKGRLAISEAGFLRRDETEGLTHITNINAKGCLVKAKMHESYLISSLAPSVTEMPSQSTQEAAVSRSHFGGVP